ncbi:FecCD family ABC transporter permease [Niallia nealsonii]|uniref:Ferrichrome ABC transporter permease n=1 Tax=Niallia nealsonii TaxID=115979 RepID=A0A2N0YZE5_9BACI|nr:iron ABC transporter permease [Niallia nealsonii]PKG22637.1 ferrichrome ABC transporter permease [Niallia nealsonii]
MLQNISQKLSKPHLIAFWHIFLFIFSLIGVFVTLVLGVSFGAKDITFHTVWSAMFEYDSSLTEQQIIYELRLPRVIGAAIVGAAFAVAGALMQGVTRNPLADAGILGINAGAMFIVTLCFAVFPSISYSLLMFFSFIGAALSTLLIFLMGASVPGGLTPMRLTISGTVIAALLHSLSTGIAIYFDLSQDLAFWYAGGVAGVKWNHLKLLVPVILITIVWAISMGRPISLIMLGEEMAMNLGIKVNRIKLFSIIAAVILAGVSVSAVGSIGFIGLVIPHIARKLVGTDYRLIIPMSGLLGAILLMMADLGARIVNPPRELAIGILVAIVGVPFFLYVARKVGRDL